MKAFKRRVPPVYEEKRSYEKDDVEHVYSKDEEDQLKDRLRALGYL